MTPLTSKDYESYLNQVNCHIFKKSFEINTVLIKIIVKVATVVTIQVNTEVLRIVYVI